MSKSAHLALWAFIGIACCFVACGDDGGETAGISELSAQQFTDSNAAFLANLDCADSAFTAKGDTLSERQIAILRACPRASATGLCKTYDAGNTCKVDCSKLTESPCKRLSKEQYDLGHCKWADTSTCKKKTYKFWKAKKTCDEYEKSCQDV